MIVTCPKCQAKFNLDETKIPPEGAWVRCGKCDEVFQVLPPGAKAPEPEPMPGDDMDLGDDLFGGDIGDDEFDFTGGSEPEPDGKGRGKAFKIFFWLLAIIMILAVVGVGALVTMGRMGVGGELVTQLGKIPVIRDLIGTPAQTNLSKEDSLPSNALMIFRNVRGSFRNNKDGKQLFVVQGQVENTSDQVRTDIMLRAVILNKEKQKVVTAKAYAGPELNVEQLRQMPLDEITRILASPVGQDGTKYVVAPRSTIPFMIVFADLPSNVSEYLTEVVSTKPLEDAPADR